MARIEYIGKKDISTDTVAGTGTVWYGNGDVQEVPDEAVPKLLVHSGHWRLAESEGASKDAFKKNSIVALIGSESLPSLVDLAEGKAAQLGDIVAGAHADSGLSAEEWNSLEQAERDELIQAHLESLRATFGGSQPSLADMERDALYALAVEQGLEPHARLGKAKLLELLGA